MPKYHVTVLIDVSTGFDVEAENHQEALEKAMDHDGCQRPSICHQCSSRMDVGDPYKIIISNADNHEDLTEHNI